MDEIQSNASKTTPITSATPTESCSTLATCDIPVVPPPSSSQVPPPSTLSKKKLAEMEIPYDYHASFAYPFAPGAARIDHKTFYNVLQACKHSLDYRTAIRTHAKLVIFGYGTYPSLLASLVSVYAQCDFVNLARKLIDQIFRCSHDLMSLNLVIETFMKVGEWILGDAKMIGGTFTGHGGGQTAFVVFAGIVAAMGGPIFGYDLGISGGVTSMEEFLNRFFPSIERSKKRESGHANAYRKFDNYLLTLFTSSLYLTPDGFLFCFISFMDFWSSHLLLGVGVGLANQSVPVYLSKMAPTKIREALNMGFRMATQLPETLNSILERSHLERGKSMLQKIHGTNNAHDELQDLIDASKAAKKQLTGINIIMFYASVLFKSLGFGNDSSLMSAVITGVVNVVATLVFSFNGGLQMIICQIAVGSMIGLRYGTNEQGSLADSKADLLLLFICAYVAAFTWSWGVPLGWLVPSEICPLKIREQLGKPSTFQ
ncbi:hypothetical protein FEM48_Zijuj07G0145000 [Ziziphus jujuba var. spinosa]|uniref:Uncharacterized protein n=1 Tax=Ziziphus jujuba var. spinosa TaxID=714518 RepID=A0A978V565_ZIZJJ|nr:hypothetical protein FEM48_Zijuj07G0145000 [Ziziphus jujuba var. spinosa]